MDISVHIYVLSQLVTKTVQFLNAHGVKYLLILAITSHNNYR